MLCPVRNSRRWTPPTTVLLDKPRGLQLVKKFSAIYGTRRFIAVCKTARNLSLSWANWIQSMPQLYFWKCILILSSHLRLGFLRGLFPSRGWTNRRNTAILSTIQYRQASGVLLCVNWSADRHRHFKWSQSLHLRGRAVTQEAWPWQQKHNYPSKSQ
jgi:hypothetical protein